MDKIKKVYIDSRYKASDSISNISFRFEIKNTLYLQSNTVCYIDDISIPHSWYSIQYLNNKLYIKRVYAETQTTGTILTIPVGSYSATRLASTIHSLLRERYGGYTNFPNDEMTCTYGNARGAIQISANSPFQILSDSEAVSLTDSAGPTFLWVGNNHELISIGLTNLRSINEVLRNNGYEVSSRYDGFPIYERGLIDLLNVHSIYIYMYMCIYIYIYIYIYISTALILAIVALLG